MKGDNVYSTTLTFGGRNEYQLFVF